MKTIYATLPIYDRIEKQAFLRGKHGGIDKPVPIHCPRHRLPSFQWNGESDNAGVVTKVEMLSQDYTGAETTAATDWTHGGWDTFTHAGLEITDAQNAAGLATASTGLISMTKGDQYRIVGTFALADGSAPSISISLPSNPSNILTAGVNNIILTSPDTGSHSIYIYFDGHSDFSFTGVTITKITAAIDITPYLNTTASYIQAWTNGGYDTFTSVTTPNITSAIKTTAAGEAYGLNAYVMGSVPANLVDDEVVFIKVILTLNSGTAPKMCLRNTGTGATISNIVTLASGVNYVHLRSTVTLASGWGVVIYNSNTELTNYSCLFFEGQKSVMPQIFSLTDDYYQYKGETLGTLLPSGIYYLKITMSAGYVYYSDWFQVDCVYENLVTAWYNSTYETFTSSGTAITSAIETGASGRGLTDTFSVKKGEVITAILYHTLNSGASPTLYVYGGVVISNQKVLDLGLNEVTFTITADSDSATLFIDSAAAANYTNSELYLLRGFSEKYLIINFHNNCDLGDILYQDGFTQTIWFESETMEPSFPQDEEGVKNGEGRFVRTFARQVKKYVARTKEMPDYMVTVFNRMKLHDTVELVDLVGDVNSVYNLEVDHDWLWDDKYYAKIDLTFDYDEAFVIAGCCNNIV